MRRGSATIRMSCSPSTPWRATPSIGVPRKSHLKPEEKLAPRAAAIVAGCNLKKEMEGRVDLLFPTAATEPRASGRKPVVSSATKRIMQAAWEVMDALPACLIGVLSHSFGNFDRVVGCGWLLADVVDLPPIDRSTAHAVGLKARTQTLKLKTKIYEERN